MSKRTRDATVVAATGKRQRREDGEEGRKGEDTRVYVGNLAFRVDEEAMRKHFGACGRVRSVDFITDRATGKFYGTAFVDFDSPAAARKALSFNGQKLLGRPMKVELAKKPSSSTAAAASTSASAGEEECRTVFVSRLPRDVTDDAMWSEFGKAGEVVNVRWVDTQSTSKAPFCCGFVEFADAAAAAKAVALFDATRALGSHAALRVNLAPDRPYKPKTDVQQEEEEEQQQPDKAAEDDMQRFNGGEEEELQAVAAVSKPKKVIIK